MKINIAICQFDITEGQYDSNMNKAAQLVRDAAAAGGELILLPEMWPSGFDFKHLGALAQELTGEAVSMLKELAAKLNVFLVGGSIPETHKGAVYNTCPIIDADGNLINKYRKVHLFSHYLNEHLYLSSGEEWALTDFEKAGENLTMGHLICYDLRFPEFTRNLALRGARLFTAPAGWPQKRIEEFETLCRARAIENRSFLACANYTDTKHGEYCGNSMIIDPFGRIIAKLGNEEGFAVVPIDTDLLQEEQTFNSIADRKNFLDEIDNSQL